MKKKIKNHTKNIKHPSSRITCENKLTNSNFLAIYQKRSCDQKPNVHKNNLCVPSSFKKMVLKDDTMIQCIIDTSIKNILFTQRKKLSENLRLF